MVALNCSDMGQAVVHLLSSSSQNRISEGTDSHYYIFLLGIQKRNCGVPKVTYLWDKLPNTFTISNTDLHLIFLVSKTDEDGRIKVIAREEFRWCAKPSWMTSLLLLLGLKNEGVT